MVTLRSNLIRILFVTAAAIIVAIFGTGAVFSQEATPAPVTTSQTDITFPVDELGNCNDLAACTNYCEDSVNQNSCMDFAKKHGFYKDDRTTYADNELLQSAKEVLGCDSADACLDFCASPDNHDVCDSWAKSNEIPGGYTDEPDKPEYLEVAKEVLGCDSAQSCSSFCDDAANADKCSGFADQVGILGGTIQEGPGGCQSGETCSAYCSDPANFENCRLHAPDENFAGPGGCNSEQSCRTFCDQNPDQCRSYAPGSNGSYVPIGCADGEYFGPGGACTKLADTSKAADCVGAAKFWDGSSCQDQPPAGIDPELPSAHFGPRPEMGGCTTPGVCYDYCKENPAACPGLDPNSPRPTDDYTPYLYYTPGTEVTHEPVESMGGCTSPAACYDYCKNNPGECGGFSDKAPRPPEVYLPGTYYTPPSDTVYVTPSLTSFYTTPVYYTPPAGSTYTTPQYYTPGMYSTPSYQTPPSGSNYVTPNYYTPWSHYSTPSGEYPTPTYSSPTYYTPPLGSNYTTPYYYTPPSYYTPYYYTPGQGGIASNYTTPTYTTPPPYTTPQYYTPYSGTNYSTPVYYTPPVYTTPTYYTPPEGSTYTSPSYYTPPPAYTSPTYYTPGTYPTPPQYTTPPPYTTPTYPSPSGGTGYTTPQYYTPVNYSTPTYYTPPPYTTPYYYTPYSSPTYYTPPEGSTYTSPSYYTPYNTPSVTYSYPTPYVSPSYGYPTPSTYYYPTPSDSYSYPTPGTNYLTPSYATPSGTGGYGTPSYGTPAYGTPSYGTPAYGTPTYETPSYGTPSYGTPTYETPSYPTPPLGVSTSRPLLDVVWDFLTGK